MNDRHQHNKREKNNKLEVSDTSGTGATPKSGGVHGNYVDYVVLQLGDHQDDPLFENALILRQISEFMKAYFASKLHGENNQK